MIDWWNLQPEWLKRLRLFFSILWRRYEDSRMGWQLSWDVAKCIYPTAKCLEIASLHAEEKP
jgi:hypothetical protein